METKFVELMPFAKIAVEDCMIVQPGEEILVVTDTRISEYMGAEAMVGAIMAAIYAAGGEPQILTFTPRERPNAELTKIAAAAMKGADGIFTLPTMTCGHTTAARAAMDDGIRFIMLGAGTLYMQTDTAYRLMPRTREEFKEIGKMTTKVADYFKKGHRVTLTSAKGTDLTMEIGERWTYNNTGVARPGELEVLPPGNVGTGPSHGCVNGRIVIDASICPVYEPLTDPVILTIRDGYIIKVEGGAQAMKWKHMAEELNDPEAYNVCEIGIGVNPKAKVSGEPLEDERIFGSAHIGIGTDLNFGGNILSKWHVDANMLNATLTIDDTLILDNGKLMV